VAVGAGLEIHRERRVVKGGEGGGLEIHREQRVETAIARRDGGAPWDQNLHRVRMAYIARSVDTVISTGLRRTVNVSNEVRRDSVLSEAVRQELNEVLKKYPVKRSAVLEALYIAQRDKNYLDDDDIQAVAEALDMTTTEVSAVVGFYTLLRRQPTGKYLIQVCTDLPCALRGAEEFYNRLCRRLDLPPEGGTTADGLFTVEEVVCLAACDRAPVAQVNLRYYENLNDETIDEVIAGLRAQG